ncbi:hypothetical protein A2U01_0094551, partial [Trifolium medium]|nr:hypothetical protein [Trifolium medium]
VNTINHQPQQSGRQKTREAVVWRANAARRTTTSSSTSKRWRGNDGTGRREREEFVVRRLGFCEARAAADGLEDEAR